jgi:hypothetical protein
MLRVGIFWSMEWWCGDVMVCVDSPQLLNDLYMLMQQQHAGGGVSDSRLQLGRVRCTVACTMCTLYFTAAYCLAAWLLC